MSNRAHRMIRRAVTILAAATLMLTAAACGTQPASTADEASGDGVLKVTTTIGMIADIVGQVGGEHVAVTEIMPPGVDPHVYKASQGDIAKFENADVIFYNGLHLEGKMTEVFEEMRKTRPTIAVAESIDESDLLTVTLEGTKVYDPHVWFDVQLWMKAVEAVRDQLAAMDAENAEDYKANADRYLAELQQLDDYAREQIATIPESGRVLITAHDAFSYFGKAYNIEVRGLQGISTASEAGSKDVTDLRDYMVEKKIKAVFVESSVSSRSIRAVVEGAEALGHHVKEGGTLFSDAMGEAGTPEGTYIGMVRHNVDTIVNALK